MQTGNDMIGQKGTPGGRRSIAGFLVPPSQHPCHVVDIHGRPCASNSHELCVCVCERERERKLFSSERKRCEDRVECR